MVRSADLISYTAEEGLRYFGQVNHAAHWRQAGALRCRIERRLTLPPVPNRPGTAMLSHPPPPPGIYFPAPSFVEPASPDPCLYLQGQLLASDSFPGQDRTKLCMASKVGPPELKSLEKTLKFPRDSPQPPGWLWHCPPGAALPRAPQRASDSPGPPLVAPLGLIPTACPLRITSGGSPRFACCPGPQVPLGVVLAIPPFNYPVNLAVRYGLTTFENAKLNEPQVT